MAHATLTHRAASPADLEQALARARAAHLVQFARDHVRLIGGVRRLTLQRTAEQAARGLNVHVSDLISADGVHLTLPGDHDVPLAGSARHSAGKLAQTVETVVDGGLRIDERWVPETIVVDGCDEPANFQRAGESAACIASNLAARDLEVQLLACLGLDLIDRYDLEEIAFTDATCSRVHVLPDRPAAHAAAAELAGRLGIDDLDLSVRLGTELAISRSGLTSRPRR